MINGGKKNFWAPVLIMLAGVVIGGFIGDIAGGLPYLSWLRYGSDFGLSSPLVLDLGVISLQFGFTIRFSICGVIGLVIAVLFYKTLL